MITLKEYIEHENGTYACLELSQASKDQLYDHVSQYVNAPVPKEEYHCTVVYSKSPAPRVESIQPRLPITVTAKSYEIFNDEYFVLLLESLELHHLFQLTKQAGAEYDYPVYNPHITISTNHTNKEIPVPDFPLVFDSYKVEPLKD